MVEIIPNLLKTLIYTFRKLHKFHKEIHKQICDSLKKKKKAERQIQGENLEVAREKRLSICKKFNKDQQFTSHQQQWRAKSSGIT